MSNQPTMAAQVATVVLIQMTGGRSVSGERRSGVETEPAEPQHTGADRGRGTWRVAWRPAKAEALADDQGETRPAIPADVDDGATSRVVGATLAVPSVDERSR